MEGFFTSPPMGYCGLPGPKREARLIVPHGLNYLELCKALLSQASPSVPLNKKTSTKDCGVQVNARVHKLIQCSLGPKTLFSGDAEGPKSLKPRSPDVFLDDGTPPVGHLRFLRPMSIYSPLFDRRLLLRKLSAGDEGEREDPEDPEDSEDSELSVDEAVSDLDTSLRLAPKRSSLQFLEQRYGFFHCKKCNVRWESAYVWCISGTSKVYYKQLCRKCQVGFNPYRVESILCKGCAQTSCACERRRRHINVKKPHRQDLCCRCRGMKLSCDATYSFKYIV
ncbi:unnamed protein product [Knipowitschia caucasica]